MVAVALIDIRLALHVDFAASSLAPFAPSFAALLARTEPFLDFAALVGAEVWVPSTR